MNLITYLKYEKDKNIRNQLQFVEKTKQQLLEKNQRNVILQKIDDGNTQLRLVTKKRKKGNRK